MSLSTPSATDRYAVVSPEISGVGPADVSFWRDYSSVIGLMTRHANCAWHTCIGFSVWHRRTAKSQWKLITSPT